MTDVLIASMTYNVETQEIDWWGAENEEDYDDEGNIKPEAIKARWSGAKSGIKTYAEADAFAKKLLEVYRKVRITKTVKYVETVFGE